MKLNKNKKYKFNPNAFITIGASRSLLCDLERSAYSFIPNAMAKIILDDDCENISAALKKYCNSNDEEEIVLGYFLYLLEQDLIFPSRTRSVSICASGAFLASMDMMAVPWPL